MTPVIYKNNIIIVTWDHAVEVYDLNNGKKKWKLKYKKINKELEENNLLMMDIILGEEYQLIMNVDYYI